MFLIKYYNNNYNLFDKCDKLINSNFILYSIQNTPGLIND